LKIFARLNLSLGQLESRDKALLLEGSWPDSLSGPARWSLDECVDARDQWIDDEATRLSEQLCRSPSLDRPIDLAGLAFLDALRVRYYLVKLLRLVVLLSRLAGSTRFSKWQVYVERELDQDYELIIRQLADAVGVPLMMVELSTRHEQPPPLAANSALRRGLARMLARPGVAPAAANGPPRFVLCGNPRILNPICVELVARGCTVWWLYDRFAVKHWLAWRAVGVRQIVCDTESHRGGSLAGCWPAEAVVHGPVDLAPALRWFIQREAVRHGSSVARIAERVDAEFRRIRPTHVVVDQDASPLPRAAIVAGRQLGAASAVVQHGVPAVQFGFVPLLADQVFVWNEASQRQLVSWKVAAERIHVTGPTCFEESALPQCAPGRRPRLLLALTTPPADGRPDSVAYHLTTKTHHAMLRAALAAARKLNCRLLIKLHPRASHRAQIAALLTEYPGLRARIVRSRKLQKLFARVDCVLSCASTAGWEAQLSGLPVIQLLPTGSADVLPPSLWRWDACVRGQEEVEKALRAVIGRRDQSRAIVPALPAGQTAASNIVDHLLARRRFQSSPHANVARVG
jgi:hypothetical protein